MAEAPPRSTITASVLLDGDAEAVLADVQRLRSGKRRVSLTVRIPSAEFPQFGEDYVLPVIESGNTQAAMDRVTSLARTARISQDTKDRLEILIAEFGRFTR